VSFLDRVKIWGNKFNSQESPERSGDLLRGQNEIKFFIVSPDGSGNHEELSNGCFSMFSHLNVHSIYSKMSGTAAPDELAAQAKKYRMSHLALTEVNGLWGFIRFVQTAREQDILPIAATNLITETNEAILLAETQKGYENICFILSRVHDDPSMNICNLFHSHSKELFVLAHHEKTLAKLSAIIPASHLFVELRPGVEERQSHRLARKFGLEMVATSDAYFLKPEDAATHKILRAIDKNSTLSQLTPNDFIDERHYFRTEKEMIAFFPNSVDAINNSQYLAERCKTDWNYINTIFPEMSLKDTHRANQKLRAQVYEGARVRYPEMTQAIKQRIEYELSVITQKGYAPYFLIVADIVKQTPATIGRGSGAASVVSYCLYITQVDPIKYNLQFERFIHPERTDMPDIDIDFPWDERDDILKYVFEKYGKERTAMVSNQVFLQPRSAVREVAKVYGFSNEEIMAITKRIGYFKGRTDLMEWINSDNRFKNLDLNDALVEVIKQSEKIMGVFRYSSVHPGGVVIVPDDIRKYVPVLMAPKGVQIVEWEKDQVEDSGLLKIDLLGNRSLAVVRDTLRQIKLDNNQYTDYHRIQPVGDPKTERILKSGRTIGVFYIESPATRLLLRKSGVVDFEHVVIYSSIIRPAANRYIDLMLERIHGKPWKLLHPDLKCLLESYGIMVYEEQVSRVARDISGFGYWESDYLRKVISKPSLIFKVPKWKRKFITEAIKRGYSRELTTKLWNMIESFSGYSFCKPHSASYAMLSFTCAYLKAHFPAEFLASVITNQGGFYSTYAYVSEARRCGIQILTPDINLGDTGYKGRKNKIRMGFMAIKGLQEKAAEKILEARESGAFQSLEDFFFRVDIDFADAMALTKAGCFAELEPELTYQEIALRVACAYLSDEKTGDEGRQKTDERGYPNFPQNQLSPEEKLKMELESFGFPVSQHPLQKFLSILDGHVKKARNIPKYEGKTINLAGVLITRKLTSTRKQEPMEFVTFEDETDIYECVMFPNSFREYADLLNWETLFIVRGKVESSFGVYTITIEKLFSLVKTIKKIQPRMFAQKPEL